MSYYAGIDIGSSAIKIALLNDSSELMATGISPTGSSFNKNAAEALQTLLDKNSLSRDELLYTVATGYGRKLFKESDESINEITANAMGAALTCRESGIVRTIINVGGQDAKVIEIDHDGHVSNFVMNDKCAAGTGRFLEMAARNLEVDLPEFAELHFQSADQPLPINSTCAVFAESEIISLLAEGHSKSEIAAGIHYSIARRIARLAGRVKIEEVILFDGGAALNRGMLAALEDELMRPVMTCKLPQITTAIGAAAAALKSFHSQEVTNAIY
ncbi:MAG: acyl-CoA dehydratase activase [Calditrichaceae bacterium]